MNPVFNITIGMVNCGIAGVCYAERKYIWGTVCLVLGIINLITGALNIE